MNPVSTRQHDLIQEGYARGLTDRKLAEFAGLSLSTVKRVRKSLGLPSHSLTVRRGRLGEQIVFNAAKFQGLQVDWRPFDNAPYDLLINGQKVDVKTSMLTAGGMWRFSLKPERSSFYGEYSYAKTLKDDCDVVAFVCLYPDGQPADIYLAPSHVVGTNVTFRLKDAAQSHPWRSWSCLTKPVAA